MIVVAGATGRVHATHSDTQRAAILALPAYAGMPIYSCAGGVSPGDLVPGDAVLLNPPETLTQYAARRRYELEIGGSVPVNGVLVPTDERTRSVVTAAYAMAAEDSGYTVRWKIGPGQYVTLDALAIRAIGTALAEFVQVLFDRNESADAGISAGTVTTTAGVDAILAGAGA